MVTIHEKQQAASLPSPLIPLDSTLHVPPPSYRKPSQITREYYQSGYWAILQTPKHVLNAVILHLVARALRWHLDRLLGLNFAARDHVRTLRTRVTPETFQAKMSSQCCSTRRFFFYRDGGHA